MSFVVFVGTLPHAVGAMFSSPLKTMSAHSVTFYRTVDGALKSKAKALGKSKLRTVYGSDREWNSLYTLWMQESRWDMYAQNPRSTARGIPQILDMPLDTPMVEQIDLGIKYIKHRYGTPTKALAFHNRHGYY